MANKIQKRKRILTKEEIAQLYQQPQFNQSEREEYFSLDNAMLKEMRKIAKVEARIFFILLMGYFRFKPVIPKVTLNNVKHDIRYICKTYFPDFNYKTISKLPSSTYARVANKVIRSLEFKEFSPSLQAELKLRLADVATIQNDPRYVFDECIAFFGQRRIALIGYTTLQDIISEVLTAETKRIEKVLSQTLSPNTVRSLKKILTEPNKLNELSGYQSIARNFSTNELKREIHVHTTIKEHYPDIKQAIEQLELSRGNMMYYSSLVQQYSNSRLKRLSKWQGLLYLVCYLFFGYRQTNDKLSTAFCHLVDKHNEAAK